MKVQPSWPLVGLGLAVGLVLGSAGTMAVCGSGAGHGAKEGTSAGSWKDAKVWAQDKRLSKIQAGALAWYAGHLADDPVVELIEALPTRAVHADKPTDRIVPFRLRRKTPAGGQEIAVVLVQYRQDEGDYIRPNAGHVPLFKEECGDGVRFSD